MAEEAGARRRVGEAVALLALMRPLRDVGSDQQAQQQDQRRGDQQLRANPELVVVVHVCLGRTAGRATRLDNGAAAMRANQVLTAHRVPLSLTAPRRTWRDLEP